MAVRGSGRPAGTGVGQPGRGVLPVNLSRTFRDGLAVAGAGFVFLPWPGGGWANGQGWCSVAGSRGCGVGIAGAPACPASVPTRPLPRGRSLEVAPLFPWVPEGGFPDPFPWGQCTSCAAFQHRVSWNGNAGDWWANARAAGAAESRGPSLGAIAVWRAGGAYGIYGHVGVVVAVASDRFTVAEMNYVGLGVVDQRVASLADPDLLGFIR